MRNTVISALLPCAALYIAILTGCNRANPAQPQQAAAEATPAETITEPAPAELEPEPAPTETEPTQEELVTEAILEPAETAQEEEEAVEYPPLPDTLDDSYKPAMVRVEGGTFTLGNGEYGTRQVTLSSFEIAETELTKAQYAAIMGDGAEPASPHRPQSKISWCEAAVICNRLSEACGYTPCYSLGGSTDCGTWGKLPYYDEGTESVVGDVAKWSAIQCDFSADGYRMPTEAEWEFAALGGNASHGTTYSGSNTIEQVAWYCDNTIDVQDVARKNPNELGLYDMSGNLWEWCWNREGDYSGTAETNPTGPEASGNNYYRVIRGGGWQSMNMLCRVKQRNNADPGEGTKFYGLRVCRSVGAR